MANRIYTYRLGEPLEPTARLVDAQIFAAHRYRNTLTEIERTRRQAVRAALGGHVDVEPLATELAALDAQIDGMRAELSRQRAAARARKVDSPLPAAIRAAVAQARDLRERVRTAKAAIASDPTVQAAIIAANERAAADQRAARAQCGVYWGTYLLVEAAADQARKVSTDPAFRPWRHAALSMRVAPDAPDIIERREAGAICIAVRDRGDEGRVSVQLQGGLAIEDLWGTSAYVRIDPVPAAAHDPTTRRGDRRRLCRTTLCLRLGSDGRAPIWGTWPLTLHRPLPPGARIKVATVQRRRRDIRRWVWELQLLLEMPEGYAPPPSGEGMIALNLGWCQHPSGGIRAGYLVGDDGYEQEIVVPRHVIERVDKAASIEGFRDRDLNAMRPQLLEAIGALAAPSNWFRAETAHLPQWRSPERFASFAHAWRARRFEGDQAAYAIIEAWRYRDEHLARYAAGVEGGARRHRGEIYRLIAAQVARRYRTLVVDDADLRELQRSPRPEDTRGEIPAAKRQQQIAAGSVLRGVLISACTRAGAVVKVSRTDVTRRCHACGSIETWDRASPERRHACAGCGQVWDQDANACRNLLRAARERIDAEIGTEGARAENAREIKLSRSQRLHAGRARRTANRPLAT